MNYFIFDGKFSRGSDQGGKNFPGFFRGGKTIPACALAGVAKLAYASDLRSDVRKDVRVRPPPPALLIVWNKQIYTAGRDKKEMPGAFPGISRGVKSTPAPDT